MITTLLRQRTAKWSAGTIITLLHQRTAKWSAGTITTLLHQRTAKCSAGTTTTLLQFGLSELRSSKRSTIYIIKLLTKAVTALLLHIHYLHFVYVAIFFYRHNYKSVKPIYNTLFEESNFNSPIVDGSVSEYLPIIRAGNLPVCVDINKTCFVFSQNTTQSNGVNNTQASCLESACPVDLSPSTP